MGWLETIGAMGRRMGFSAGEVLASAGRADERLMILLSGSVTLMIPGKVAGEIGAGGFIGAEGVADEGPSPFKAVAAQPGHAVVISRADAVALMRADPEFARQLAAVLASHVRMLTGEAPARKPAPKQPEPAQPRPVPPPPKEAAVPPPALRRAPEQAGAEEGPKKPVLPAGHPRYGLAAPESWKKYTLQKEQLCPVCNGKFSDLSPSSYKLKTKEIRDDMRVIYDDFEILWYSVRVCPHCNAAAPSNAFSRFNSRDARFLKSRGYFSDFPKFGGWSDPRRVDEVFEALYLSIHCLSAAGGGDIQTEAQIWRRLMWLYGDVGDREREALAKKFTLEKYIEVYQTKTLSGEEEEQLNVILGDLYRDSGDRQTAYKHYLSVVQLGKSGNATLYRHATDAIGELRAQGQ